MALLQHSLPDWSMHRSLTQVLLPVVGALVLPDAEVLVDAVASLADSLHPVIQALDKIVHIHDPDVVHLLLDKFLAQCDEQHLSLQRILPCQ